MQLINFTMWSQWWGGAFFSELLDDNYSKDYCLNYDNYRNPITNEYAEVQTLIDMNIIV